MNKLFAYILIITLLIGLVGCAKPVATPTDVTPTEVQNNAVQSDVILQENLQQDDKKTNPEKTVSQAKPKEEQQATTTVVPQKQEQPSENGGVNNGYMADVLVEHPTFTTEAALQSWLKGSNTEYFANDRTQMMGTLSANNKVTYRRPAIAANTAQSGYQLERISTYPSGNAIYFHYRSTTNLEEILEILPQNDGFYNPALEMYEGAIERVEQNKEWNYSSVADGITFYYTYYPTKKNLAFTWEQFGKIMKASCRKIDLDETTVHQKAQQLIPLIKIEQVTVPLNSDHVTQ
ncbi:MAG: hypothetical protein IJP35_06435 [Clostridia bacterium]|nr:hypothetical protein [Clostridia bacterium]